MGDALDDHALDDHAVEAEAALLDEAERTAVQIRQSTLAHPSMTMADAYRVQAAWRDLKVARGETIIGHKIGLTSRAMQAAMKIDTPDSGFLTDRMEFDAGGELVAGAFCDPKLEVELAFVLASDLSGSEPFHFALQRKSRYRPSVARESFNVAVNQPPARETDLPKYDGAR
jgi:2-oxo-hept-3-ene-1,7-dioate hydratase